MRPATAAQAPTDRPSSSAALICIDLQARFGRRYRVRWEANGATRPNWPREQWPWLMELRCKFGVVYPRGGEILAAWTDRPRIGAKLRELPCVRTARGHEETVVTFHVDDAPAVFEVLRPYRRPQLSDAERARRTALLTWGGTVGNRPENEASVS